MLASVMIIDDLLPKKLLGYWHDLEAKDIFCAGDFGQINLDNVFLALSMPQEGDVFQLLEKIPHGVPVIISCHVEYIRHEQMIRWFRARHDQPFLLLYDWITYQHIWPENVTCLRWITWHHQLSTITKVYGICDDPVRPSRKISSLSHQHEYHKAAITSYLVNEWPAEQISLSWWDIRTPSRMYYLDPDYYIHPRISAYLKSPVFQTMRPVKLEGQPSSALNNANWRHSAYIDCAINLTNESVFNSNFEIDGDIKRLPGPYLTEKTWKPLLAGRAFLPIGQADSIQCLVEAGLKFDWLEKSDLDSKINEDDRLLAAMDFLDHLRSISCDDLWSLTLDDVRHNLHAIKSGSFAAACDKINQLSLGKIHDWVVDSKGSMS